MLNQLQIPFDKIQDQQRWFIDVAQKAADTKSPLGKNEWSISEIIEHLVIVDRYMISSFQSATDTLPTASLALKLKRKIVSFVLERGIKVPVPVARVLPTGHPNLGELLEEWKCLRRKLGEHLESVEPSDLELLALNHPRAGALNLEEALIMTNKHLTYHTIRLKRLLRNRSI